MTEEGTTAPVNPVTGLSDAEANDIRLVVTDMDGTLLGEGGATPEGLFPLMDELNDAGIELVPASGRQYAAIKRVFEPSPLADEMTYIAENGTFVVRAGETLGTIPMPVHAIPEIITIVREQAAAGLPVGAVVCTPRLAYTELTHESVVEAAAPYYAQLEVVADSLAQPGEVLKIAIYDTGNAEADLMPLLSRFQDDYMVTVSGPNWIDIMSQDANKGNAIAILEKRLELRNEQILAFGDFLNDRELLAHVHHSYAMANAHPEIAALARHQAPDHREAGVLQVLRALLEQRS